MYMLEQGQRFERYRILRTLGSGIAGVSYVAEEDRRQRTVKLKLLRPGPDFQTQRDDNSFAICKL